MLGQCPRACPILQVSRGPSQCRPRSRPRGCETHSLSLTSTGRRRIVWFSEPGALPSLSEYSLSQLSVPPSAEGLCAYQLGSSNGGSRSLMTPWRSAPRACPSVLTASSLGCHLLSAVGPLAGLPLGCPPGARPLHPVELLDPQVLAASSLDSPKATWVSVMTAYWIW